MTIQLTIQLKDVSKPAVWRKVAVHASMTFEDLHDIIQMAFGWDDAHLYAFSPEGFGSKPQIWLPDEELEEGDFEPHAITLGEIFTEEGQEYTYIYDFGDKWIHEISVEEISEEESDKVVLLNGKGACPPEDCGGPWGYANLKEVLDNPKHPEHKDMKEWLGLKPKESWDAKAFSKADVQEELDDFFE